LKTNVDSLDASSSLSEINALNPVAYDWLDPEKGGVRQYGFIAQQVQPIFPELVSTTSATALTPDGTLGLNYLGLIAPIVKAIQGFSADLTSLETTVSGLADSFTSKVGNFGRPNADTLCLSKSNGTQVCVTGDQLSAFLSATPSVQVSAPTITISGTSTPPSIQIKGDNPAVIHVGGTYYDLGVIATDSQGHSLPRGPAPGQAFWPSGLPVFRLRRCTLAQAGQVIASYSLSDRSSSSSSHCWTLNDVFGQVKMNCAIYRF